MARQPSGLSRNTSIRHSIPLPACLGISSPLWITPAKPISTTMPSYSADFHAPSHICSASFRESINRLRYYERVFGRVDTGQHLPIRNPMGDLARGHKLDLAILVRLARLLFGMARNEGRIGELQKSDDQRFKKLEVRSCMDYQSRLRWNEYGDNCC